MSGHPDPDDAHNPDRPPTVGPAGERGCDLCHGTGWASFLDPFFGGALIDGRCPACADTTVRARKSRWEDNHGHKVGPR